MEVKKKLILITKINKRNAAKWKHKFGGQIQKLQNSGKFMTTSGSGYIPSSINITPSKKLPTAVTFS